MGGLGPAGARGVAGDRGGRPHGEGIVIVGMDANPQAREAIAKGGNFEASMAQDFKGIGRTVAHLVKRHLAGEKIKQSVVYVPTTLITSENVKQ
jgi:ribose transport system substrate-binding protein